MIQKETKEKNKQNIKAKKLKIVMQHLSKYQISLYEYIRIILICYFINYTNI